MNKTYAIFVGFLVALIFVAALGMRPDTRIQLSQHVMPSDLDAYLASSEAAVANIRPNAAKEIIWFDPQNKTQTDLAIVYIHGFSASKVEIAPVPQNVAKTLGANLYLTRLKGHGRDGDAMAEATLSDWAKDTKEAVEIGRRLGKKIILISTSTGAPLATWAASNPSLNGSIHSLVSLSANYEIKAAPTALLNMPWAETFLPMVLGSERSFEPANKGQASGWTTKYPSVAIFPMGALLRMVSKIDYSKITIPHFFIYSTKDRVIEPKAIEAVAKRWGAKTDMLIVDDAKDSYQHVIAGDILSPNTTERVSKAIVEWVLAN